MAPVLLVGRWLLARLREFVTLLILGALVIWLLPAQLDRVAAEARARPLPAAGWGFLALIAGYALAAIAAVVILLSAIMLGIVTLGALAWAVLGVGFSALGLAFAVFQLLVTYGSKLVVAYLVGRLLLLEATPGYAGSRFWPLVLGIALYVIVRVIPFIGWLAGVAATLIGLGAMWLAWQRRRVVEA